MRHLIFTLTLGLLIVSSLAAQQAQPATVSLQLNDTDIAQAFTTLSQQGNVTILGDSSVKGKITCSLSGVTAEEALDTLCKMNKLEWYKTYASPGMDEKLSASKLFTLLEAIKALGGLPVICEDPKTKTQTVYIPSASPADTTTIAAGLKLKQIYLVRAIPDPKVADANKQTAALPNATPSDAKNAADQVWNYFNQMPLNMQVDAMHELRHKFYDSMTPEQRQQMGDQMRQRFGGDRGGPGGPGRNGGQGGQGGQGQGGGHGHNDQPKQ